ncbi:hypothetical protein IBX35_03475 [Candidatus Bathyarchaeota archaeon]|nr:hypothetical protein [Candidatus Bathyarchaeota archaeon]
MTPSNSFWRMKANPAIKQRRLNPDYKGVKQPYRMRMVDLQLREQTCGPKAHMV